MATYSELIGKRVESFDNDPTKSITYTVTVASSDGQNRYFIDGVQQKQLRLYEGVTYNFDYSAASSHPFRFSTTSDGTHGGGSEYTTGVTVDSNITTIVVATGAPNLFYYCSSHSGMGGRANTPTQDSVQAQMWFNKTTSTFKTVPQTDAWVSTSSMITPRATQAGGGIRTSAIISGKNGANPSDASLVESYNGTGWTSLTNVPAPRGYASGTGSDSEEYVQAGGGYPSKTTDVYDWNGSSWTSGTGIPTATIEAGMCGPAAAAFFMGGNNGLNTSYERSGGSWTAGGTMAAGVYAPSAVGTQTAALSMGGVIYPGGYQDDFQSYDGTSWTALVNLPGPQGYAGAAGVQTLAMIIGGAQPPPQTTSCLEWNGTSFNSVANLATARNTMARNATTTDTAVAPPGNVSAAGTEEYNRSANVITAAAWASGGSLNTGRTLGGSAITSGTSGIVFGGSAPYTGKTESYDGSSFSETGDMNTARGYLSGFGTSTAAVAAGGYNAPNNPQSLVEEWNGSAWSEETNLPAARKSAGNCGTLTAGLIFGGSSAQPYGPNIVNTTFEYDGSSWTTGGTLPEAKGQAASGGTQTAAFYAGGRTAPGRSAKTAFYNGSSWSEGADVATISPSSGGLGATGTTSAGLGTSGDNLTNIYDGTAWATSPNYSTARNRGFGGATASDALLVGGYSPSLSPNYTNHTEEFNGEIETLNVETLTQS